MGGDAASIRVPGRDLLSAVLAAEAAALALAPTLSPTTLDSVGSIAEKRSSVFVGRVRPPVRRRVNRIMVCFSPEDDGSLSSGIQERNWVTVNKLYIYKGGVPVRRECKVMQGIYLSSYSLDSKLCVPGFKKKKKKKKKSQIL
ncbi:hypothetical protein ACKS0A_08839 [Histoplasma ohiense]